LEIEFYGPESPYFSFKIRKLLTRGCQFGGFRPQAEIGQRIAESDIGFFSLSDATFAYATPTKLFDYIEAGLPIVASLPEGAARDIVERFEIGLVADPGDVVGLARCLEEMTNSEKLRVKCKVNMQSIRDQFSPLTQVEKWNKILYNMDLGGVQVPSNSLVYEKTGVVEKV